jgi:hypothetical protein
MILTVVSSIAIHQQQSNENKMRLLIQSLLKRFSLVTCMNKWLKGTGLRKLCSESKREG